MVPEFLTVNEGGVFQAHGGIGAKLLSVNMDAGALRPFLDEKGRSFVSLKVNQAGQRQTFQANTVATLRYDEWKAIDKAVLDISRQRLTAAQDLQSRGLTYAVGAGMGATVLQWETSSDISDAEMDMEAQKSANEDRVVFEPNYLPLPITHKSFTISARALAASRRDGSPLDTTNAQVAARKVAEKIEDTILTGASTFAFGGGTLYGYKDFTYRNTVSLSENWDDSSCTGEDILDDVLAMLASAYADRHYGPFMLYVPTAYDVALNDDFKAASDKSIRSRLLEVPNILDIRVADRLTADNVLLVEMLPETIRLVNAMPITTVSWEEEGGFKLKFKILAIMVPWLRADQDGRSGVIHLS